MHLTDIASPLLKITLDFPQTPVPGWKRSGLETKENVRNA